MAEKLWYSDVNSFHMNELIQASAATAQVKELVDNLRTVEKNLRNIAAHQIVSITEDMIRKQTGFTGKQIMDKIKTAFSYAGINVKTEWWNSYDDMNKAIIEEMSVMKRGQE